MDRMRRIKTYWYYFAFPPAKCVHAWSLATIHPLKYMFKCPGPPQYSCKLPVQSILHPASPSLATAPPFPTNAPQ